MPGSQVAVRASKVGLFNPPVEGCGRLGYTFGLKMDAVHPQRFAARAVLKTFGDVLVSQLLADAGSAVRSAADIAVWDPDCMILIIARSGEWTILQDGRKAPLQAGDLAALDSSRPFEIRMHTTCVATVLALPRTDFTRYGLDLVPTVTRLTAEAAVSRVVAPQLWRLAQPFETAPAPAVIHHLGESVLSMVRALAAASTVRAPDRRAELRAAVIEYIDARLGDPALRPEQIARAHHISSRYLYQLLADDGDGVAEIVRRKRLDRCMADLRDPSLQAVPVAAIARRWGFPNAAHFSRLFRATFGCSPRQERQRARRAIEDVAGPTCVRS